MYTPPSFIPEGDAEGFIVRINTYKYHGYFPPETAEELIAAVGKRKYRPFPDRYCADL